MKPTREQQAVIEADDPVIKVAAFAGTGKTTTLHERARAHPDRRMLYLTFTRAMRHEAEERFADTPNVQVMGVHSLAWRSYANAAGGPLARGWNVRGLYASHLVSGGVIPARGISRMDAYRLAYATLDLLNAFCNSPHEDIREMPLHGVRSIALRALGSPEQAVALAEQIIGAWRDGSPSGPFDTITHDGYLKLFQLTHPDIGAGVDEVLFDEAQDASPVMAHMVNNASARRVFVGDRHQSIYAFRYAMNALEAFDGAEYALTESWRFGEEIANLATLILSRWKDERRMIHGLGGECRIGIGIPKRRTAPAGMAYLARTNLQLFERAIAAADLERKLLFIGGFETYRFEQAENAWRFHNGERVPKPPFSLFNSYDEMIAAAEDARDLEILTLHKIVMDYGKHIPDILRRIRARVVTDAEDENTVILSTAHRAKGLEFPRVVLEDGFLDIDEAALQIGAAMLARNLDRSPIPEEEAEAVLSMLLDATFREDEELKQEINLLYVAATRAQQELLITDGVARMAVADPQEILLRAQAAAAELRKKEDRMAA